MTQIDDWYVEEDGREYTIVSCTRSDCTVSAKGYSNYDSWEILPEYAYLFDEALVALESASIPLKEKIIYVPKAKKIDVWYKTGGRCYYCGLVLDWETTFTIDHIVPRSKGGKHHIENVVPCCRSCNSGKGNRTLEDFRFSRSMQLFQQQTGVNFTIAQLAYLKSIGVYIEIPTYIFWFEQQSLGS